MNDIDINIDELKSWIKFAFYESQTTSFKEYLSDYVKRKLTNISSKFKQSAIAALIETQEDYKKLKDSEEGIDEDDIDSGYFFLDYFKKGEAGFTYKQGGSSAMSPV